MSTHELLEEADEEYVETYEAARARGLNYVDEKMLALAGLLDPAKMASAHGRRVWFGIYARESSHDDFCTCEHCFDDVYAFSYEELLALASSVTRGSRHF